MIKRMLKIWGYEPIKDKENRSVEEIRKMAKIKGYALCKIEDKPMQKSTTKRTPKERVIQAQKRMHQQGEKVTVLGLSKKAGVSRTTARKYMSKPNQKEDAVKLLTPPKEAIE